MKNNFTKTISFLLLLSLFIITISGCATTKETYKGDPVLITMDVCNMASDGPEGMATYLSELAPEIDCEIAAEESGVQIYLQDGQLEEWDSLIESKLAIVDSGAGLEINDSYTKISYCYDMNYLGSLYGNSGMAAMREVSLYPIIYCALYQELHGIQQWKIEVELRNSMTNKLVFSSVFERGEEKASGEFSPTDENWLNSFILTEDEIDELIGDAPQEVRFFEMKSTFLDTEELLAVTRETIGRDYPYLYANEKGEVFVGLNDSMKTDSLSKATDRLNQIIEQFATEGNDYKIEANDSYTDIAFYFDANLSEQTQVNYVAYTETTCLIIQALSEQNQLISLHIINSATGTAVADGDSVSGLEWKME